jgi:hypothetical protein
MMADPMVLSLGRSWGRVVCHLSDIIRAFRTSRQLGSLNGGEVPDFTRLIRDTTGCCLVRRIFTPKGFSSPERPGGIASA